MSGFICRTSQSCSVPAATTHRTSTFLRRPASDLLIANVSVYRTIFTLQENRSPLRILGGIPGSPRLHMLNGHVDTPLFRHLGSSSWHNFDAALINWMGHLQRGWVLIYLSFLVSLLLTVFLTRRCLRRRRGSISRNRPTLDRADSEQGILCMKEA